MLYYLHHLSDQFGPLNLFQYVSFRSVMAAGTAMLICLLYGPMTIRMLTRLKLGQPLRGADEVNKLADLHKVKAGTPTMGGLLVIFSVVTSSLLWAEPANAYLWVVVGSMLFLGALGFWDDYTKVAKKNSAGISGKTKLAGQLAVALFVTAYLFLHPSTNVIYEGSPWTVGSLHFPFFANPIVTLPWFLAFIFFAIVIMGSSNAVNLTDGLDGLAIGCTASVAAVYAVFSYTGGTPEMAKFLRLPYIPGAAEITIFCSALFGASLGFLWWNCHPAKVFMGDTGSLAIGGTLAVIAIVVHQELALVIAGAVFVMEAGSVMMQVASFKLTKKRIFAMTPIHHHFELKGWNESTVVIRFWILSILFGLLALTILKVR